MDKQQYFDTAKYQLNKLKKELFITETMFMQLEELLETSFGDEKIACSFIKDYIERIENLLKERS